MEKHMFFLGFFNGSFGRDHEMLPIFGGESKNAKSMVTLRDFP